MTRPALLDRQRANEKRRDKQRRWKAKQIPPENMITCAAPGCGIKRAKAAIIYGNGGENGFVPACSQTCAERLRQMGLA